MSAFERVPSASRRRLYSYFLSLGDDVDALLRAVEAAPLLWAKDKWTGNGAAPLFIEAITTHASRIASCLGRPCFPTDPDPKLIEEFYATELPEYFRRSTCCLLAREDGWRLAIDYARELIQRTSWPRRKDDSESRVKRVALDALIAGLRDTAIRPSDVQEFARRRLPSSGAWSRRAEYLSVAGLLVNTTTTAEHTWAEITTLLVDADEDDIFGTLDPYLIGTHLFVGLARALAETASPREAWLGAWRALFPRRERARFAVLTVKGLQSSAYLAMLGLAALQWLIKKRDQDAKELWQVASDGLRRLGAAPHERGLRA